MKPSRKEELVLLDLGGIEASDFAHKNLKGDLVTPETPILLQSHMNRWLASKINEYAPLTEYSYIDSRFEGYKFEIKLRMGSYGAGHFQLDLIRPESA